jgi:hypothetical protein
MPVTFKRFGAFKGVADQDLRITISGPARKNALEVIASYELVPTAPAYPPVYAAFQETTFWGRILAFEGTPDTIGIPSNQEVVLNTAINDLQPSLFLDHALHSIGPHTFLLPLAQLEGNIQSSQGGTLTIILSRAYTAVVGQLFIPHLTVGGQTVLSGGA